MTLPYIDEDLARRLVDSQFPQWASLPLRRLDPAGLDNIIYRLGEDLSVRLPRHAGAIDQAETEMEWLPRLAPLLPLAVPTPVAVGRPDFGYPWSWAVSRWLPGEPATADEFGDSLTTAEVLAEFLLALQRVPTDGALLRDTAGLARRDVRTREAIDELAGSFDRPAMLELWEAALTAPSWDRPPVWCHGDFHTGNLLTSGGRVVAVIDFGGLGVGDPAIDLQMAFTLLAPTPRTTFREMLGVDDAAWLRAKRWALTGGLLAYSASARSNSVIAAQTSRQIKAALADD